MIIKVKTLVFSDNFEYGDVHVMRSKMKAVEWSQHYTAIFQTRKGR